MNVRFSVVGFGGTNTAFAGFGLKPWSERSRGQAAIQQEVQNRINGVAGVQAFVFAPPTLPGHGRRPAGAVRHPLDRRSAARSTRWPRRSRTARRRAAASSSCRTRCPSISRRRWSPSTATARRRSALPVSDIGQTLTALVGGGSVSKFDLANRSYDVITQVDQSAALQPGEPRIAIMCEAPAARWCRFRPSCRCETRAAPVAIEQFNQLNSATISALPLPGVATGDALAVIRQIAGEVMPAGFYEDFAGQSRLEITRGQFDARRIRPRHHHHLSGARGAVREFPRSADHHADRADVDLRSAGAAQSRRLHAQHLHRGRPDHADRPDHQARHPDGAVRQPAARWPGRRSSKRSSRRRASGCARS